MDYIEAPHTYDEVFRPILFMGGGITGCPDWQAGVKEHFHNKPLGTLINPRRENFEIEDNELSKEQIAWEYRWLRRADAIMFWFPKEGLCQITLFELGAHLERNTQLFIGCHDDYKRVVDVTVQVALRRPDIDVYTTLEDVLDKYTHWAKWWRKARGI